MCQGEHPAQNLCQIKRVNPSTVMTLWEISKQPKVPNKIEVKIMPERKEGAGRASHITIVAYSTCHNVSLYSFSSSVGKTFFYSDEV